MTTEEIKIFIQKYELNKFERILKLTNSPIEEFLVANIYQYFLQNGFLINLISQQSTGIRITSDNKAHTVYHVTNNDKTLKIEIDKGKNEFKNPLTGDPERIYDFEINCIDVIYKFLPQHPIFDMEQVRYADFVIDVYDHKYSHLESFVIECDSFAWHNTREQLEKDNNRNKFITKHGYKILRFTGARNTYIR